MQNIIDILNGFNAASIVFRLCLAVLMGGIIGLERGIKGRAAGMRTYMLVCIGAAMVMITSQHLALQGGILDVSRMGAQVISGIGFLGAGTIIITKERHVRGLTTAAGLWASATMGLAIGVGFYLGAFIGMFFIIFTTSIMHNFDNVLTSRSRAMDVYVEIDELGNIRKVLNGIKSDNIKITYMEVMQSKYTNDNDSALLISLLLPSKRAHFEVLADLNSTEHVKFAEEV